MHSDIRGPYSHTPKFIAKVAAKRAAGLLVRANVGATAQTMPELPELPEKSYSQAFIDRLCGPGSLYPSGGKFSKLVW
jgi:hypothetical protein